MANSYVDYTGNGSTTQRAVTFPFLSRSHVTVTVNGVSTSFTWVNDGLIDISPAPANGTAIRIKRSTSPTTRLVDYSNGAGFSEDRLDEDSLQAFYLAQESNDTAAAGMVQDTDLKWNANSKVIKNVASGVSANDAVNKGQLDAASIAAGNVPVPTNPGDDGKYLKANGGSWAWVALSVTISMISDAASFMKTFLASSDAAAARANISAQQNVITTRGDLVTGNASGVAARFALGANGKVLSSDGSDLVWIDQPSANAALNLDSGYI